MCHREWDHYVLTRSADFRFDLDLGEREVNSFESYASSTSEIHLTIIYHSLVYMFCFDVKQQEHLETSCVSDIKLYELHFSLYELHFYLYESHFSCMSQILVV